MNFQIKPQDKEQDVPINHYEIQIYNNNNNRFWYWIPIDAINEIEAIKEVTYIIATNPKYYGYYILQVCSNPQTNGIIPLNSTLQEDVYIQEGTKEMNSSMVDNLYDFMYMGDYNKNISILAELALPEVWTLKEDEENLVLKKYLDKTFERLQYEGKIVMTEKYCALNTGLFTNNYEDIYILAERSLQHAQSPNFKEWIFKEFCTEYRFDSTDIVTLPERANYFEDPSLLIFDWHYPVRVQYGHILDNPKNQARLPESILNSNMRLKIFTDVIDTSIKKVIANYKLAVPQYYDGQIQLLIPLYFENDNKPDLALAVTKKNGYYQGHTCLTLDMAYSNARAIAKPESNWLTT